jgi:hypothetical protein
MEFFQLSDEQAGRLQSRGRVARGASELDGARSLQACELMVLPNVEAAFFLGRKSPIFYYDARASQFQVNYVDTGCKLDVRCKPLPGNKFSVDVRTEMAATDKVRLAGTPATAAYPQNVNFNTTTTLPDLQPGESALIGRWRGQSAAEFLQRTGVPAQSSADNVVTVITLERL